MYENKTCLNDALKQKEISHGYYLGEFYNKTGYSFAKDVSDIWYSFDSSTNNFHIVPDKTAENAGKYIETCEKLFEALKEQLPVLKNMSGYPRAYCCKCHSFKHFDSGNYQYLISFNRLWCDEKNCIHNNFGQMQFMRYKIIRPEWLRIRQLKGERQGEAHH